MPEFRKRCDPYQGYNFKKDKQTPCGYITSLTIGGTALAVDTTCKDPTNPTSDIKVVAVCSDVLWELGVTDAVYFTGQVSVGNRQAVMQLLFNTFMNTEVIYQFTVYDYDPAAKVYFKAFHCNATNMKGLLEKRGDQALTVCSSSTKNVIKAWGLSV
jgi:hypothetical protein